VSIIQSSIKFTNTTLPINFKINGTVSNNSKHYLYRLYHGQATRCLVSHSPHFHEYGARLLSPFDPSFSPRLFHMLSPGVSSPSSSTASLPLIHPISFMNYVFCVENSCGRPPPSMVSPELHRPSPYHGYSFISITPNSPLNLNIAWVSKQQNLAVRDFQQTRRSSRLELQISSTTSPRRLSRILKRAISDPNIHQSLLASPSFCKAIVQLSPLATQILLQQSNITPSS